MVLHVRASGDPGLVASRLREEVLRIDRTLPAFDIHTLNQEMDAALIQERLVAMLSSLFGGLALLLAGVGLYGLLAFGVARRSGEMGVRMALGAAPGDLVRMILGEAFLLVLAGIAAGVPIALGVARFAGSQISGLLFGLRATDSVSVAVATLSAIAAYLPARRASRVDPMAALRNE
jgi:ABC-type antimicrobial peptide transport system permease subunit